MKGVESMNQIVAKARTKVLCSPQAVYHAFVDANTMSNFWFTRHDNGLENGKSVLWFVGNAADSIAIEVKVIDLVKPERILVDWGGDGEFTRVEWRITATEDGHSILTIQESGFSGTETEQFRKALDSTGGFNQVVVALKALLEHNACINVVADHA